jgi:hypothetical protein
MSTIHKRTRSKTSVTSLPSQVEKKKHLNDSESHLHENDEDLNAEEFVDDNENDDVFNEKD